MGRISIVSGDITKAEAQALVTEDFPQSADCPPGQAILTLGSEPGKSIIHSVGPLWRGGRHGEDEILAGTYRAGLNLAKEHQIRSVAFPAISTGEQGYPPEMAARIAYSTVASFLFDNPLPEKVLFVCGSSRDLEIYRALETEAEVSQS